MKQEMWDKLQHDLREEVPIFRLIEDMGNGKKGDLYCDEWIFHNGQIFASNELEPEKMKIEKIILIRSESFAFRKKEEIEKALKNEGLI